MPKGSLSGLLCLLEDLSQSASVEYAHRANEKGAAYFRNASLFFLSTSLAIPSFGFSS
jgi:hypothetical protein